MVGNLVQLAFSVGKDPGDLDCGVLLVELNVLLGAERGVMGLARVHSFDAHVVVGGGHRLARHTRALGHRFGDEVAHVLVLALRRARLPREHELLRSFDLLVVGLGIGLGIVRGAPCQTGHSTHRSNGPRRDELAAIEVEFHFRPSLYSSLEQRGRTLAVRPHHQGSFYYFFEVNGLNLMFHIVLYQLKTIIEGFLRTTARESPISSSTRTSCRRSSSRPHPAQRASPRPSFACRQRSQQGFQAARKAYRRTVRPCGPEARPP